MEELSKALRKLMPNGGWSVTDGVITVHEDGEVHGYTVPSDSLIQSTIDSITSEEVANEYKLLRQVDMPTIGDQLDIVWKQFDALEQAGITLLPETVNMSNNIKATKAKHPKPVK